jgi:folate-binding protein YgfZ
VAEAVQSEYAAAREGAALAGLPDRGVLEASGPQRQKFLQAILSNDVLSREPGQGCRAALMSVKGHLLAFMRVLVQKDVVRLEMPADRLKTVEDALVFYRVAAPVRFKARPTTVLALMGPEARGVLARAGCEVPELAPEAHVPGTVAGEPVLVVRAGDMPADGYVLHAKPEAAAPVSAALQVAGAVPIGRDTLDVLRIEDGRPWFGPDITEQNLLHETGLVGEYHSPTKGCYVGQEVIARLDARGGNVNKTMRGLRLSATAQAGSTVTSEGKEVGRITTAGVSPRLGPIAMGYVHRSRFEPGTHVEVDGAPAAVVRLPFEVMERAVRETRP